MRFPESGPWDLQTEVARIQAAFPAEELRARQAKFVRIIDELIARFQDRYEVIKAGTFENDGWTGTSTFRPPVALLQSFEDACNGLGLSRHPMYWIVTPDSEVPEEVKPKGFWAEHVRIYDPHSGKGSWSGLVNRRWDETKGRFVERRMFDRKAHIEPYYPQSLIESAEAFAGKQANEFMLRLCQDAVLKLRAWRRAIAAVEPLDAMRSGSSWEGGQVGAGFAPRENLAQNAGDLPSPSPRTPAQVVKAGPFHLTDVNPPAFRSPSEQELASLCESARTLIESVNRYSTLVGGQSHAQIQNLAWADTVASMRDAAFSLEGQFNPSRFAWSQRVFNYLHRPAFTGWPLEALQHSLHWLFTLLGQLLELMDWKEMSEGHLVIHQAQNGVRRDIDHGGDIFRVVDSATFVWPTIDAAFTTRLENVTRELFGIVQAAKWQPAHLDREWRSFQEAKQHANVSVDHGTQANQADEPSESDFETSKAAQFVFIPSGSGYEVCGFGERGHFALRGFSFIHRLLQSAGNPVLSVELEAGVSDELTNAGNQRSRQELIDKPGIRNLKERLQEIANELEADPVDSMRAELEDEKERIQKELLAAVGKSGTFDPEAKRRQTRIQNRLTAAYAKLRQGTPPCSELAAHFEAAIHQTEGVKFVYKPICDIASWLTS